MNKHTEETLALLAMLEEENPTAFECLADDLMDDDDFENPYQEAYDEFLEKNKGLVRFAALPRKIYSKSGPDFRNTARTIK